MAARSHVDMRVTSEVVERRLRPIYDCLDNGNNKKAIQEADKVLKKQKDLQCARVLKALALLRLGRHDDSSVILHDVHDQHPTDEATLQAMAICYREIHKHDTSLSYKPWKYLKGNCRNALDLIADMYENAHKSRPDNEEILTSLFMAYVRLGDHKKQQQTAMLLHKLRPQKNPYYFWAIMSIVMQAHNCPDNNLAQKMFLPLADRMTKKFVEDDKIEAEAEVQMYLIILELMEKWEECIQVLEGPLGEKLVSELNFRETKAAEFYTKLQKWSRTNAAYRKLLIQNPDHIQWWKQYIKSMIQLSQSNWQPDKQDADSDEVDHTETKALSFIQECIDRQENGRQNRGPYLAQLEVIKHCQEAAGSTCRKYGDPLELLENYYDKFGDRNCCFGDIKCYLEILTVDEQSKFSEVLDKKCQLRNEDGSYIYAENDASLPSGDAHTVIVFRFNDFHRVMDGPFIESVTKLLSAISLQPQVKQMQRHITVLQLSHCLGCHENLSKDEKLQLAKELIERHKHGLDFGTELLTTDLQFSDNYLLLAVALLLDIWQNHDDRGMVWQIIVQLEVGLNHSQSSFQIKLLLIRLYCSMGAFGPCPVLYDGMEIKHIMNDTLGHIVSNHVGRLGHFMAACAMYGTMLRFFTVNHKETAEYLIASYKYGSFTKINEFVKFRERLQNSLQYASATAERMLLDLVLETNSHISTEQMIMYMEIDPAKDKTNYNQLCDNRDFTVMSCFDPLSKWNTEEIQLHSFKEEIAWLKIRNLTLRILAASVMLGQEIDHDHQTNNGVTHDGKRPIHSVLQDLQTQLSDHIAESCQCFTQEYRYPVQGPFRTRISSFLQGKFHEMFLEMLDNVNYVHSLQDIGIDKIDSEKEERLKSSVPNMGEGLLKKHKCSLLQEENDQKSLDPCVLENLVLFSETLSHICVLVGVCYKMLKPVKTVLSRRNKKKKGNTIPMPCTFDNYNGLVTGLEKVCHDLHLAVVDIDPVFLSVDLSTLQLTDSLSQQPEQEELEKEMWRKVERSYQQSVAEVTEFLHKKMQYLNSLHL